MSEAEDPVIAALRTRFEQVRASELKRMEKRLRRLGEQDREFVTSLTREIISRLLDTPGLRLGDAEADARARLLRELFDLDADQAPGA
jgi:glutamyl-tRNA reductase